MRAHIQGFLNHYNVKLRLQVVVYCLVPLWSFEPRWSGMIMALRAFLSVLCPDCNSVCRLRCEKSWRVCLRWICTLSRDQLLIEKIGFSNVLWCDLTEFEVFPWQINTCCTSTPPPPHHHHHHHPNNLSGTHWDTGFWVGVKLVKCRNRVKNHTLTCHCIIR